MLPILSDAPPGDAAAAGVALTAEARLARSAWPVALVSMPFVSAYRPSIQLGLLKAIATTHAFPATTFHLNLDFARQIGPQLYEALCQHRGRLFGDWLFSLAAFDAEAPDPDDGLLTAFAPDVDRLLRDLAVTPERLRELRHSEVPRYLDRLVDTIPWERFRVVGFTSTFQQSVAAFALATRLKRRYPHLTTVFGGANFEGEMGRELVRSVECVDYAVIGEGDRAFPEFLVALAEGRDPARVPGVVCRRDGAVTPLQTRPPFKSMDELPIPDYDEYFEHAEALGLLPDVPRRQVYLPFESSRGCWWGQKHHCTFCGLNGSVMTFRPKSPDRVLGELAHLASRYRTFQFEAVDNIVDTSYLKQFFPLLSETGADYAFFYEVKSNLTRDKIKTLREGGVVRMQPGIESLNSHVLKLMRKGVTALQNVNTLRWAAYYGIDVGWNMIWGFPGETDDDYREQCALLPQLMHLQPPSGAGRIWMERYSPIFVEREVYPARRLEPEASYGYVYPHRYNLANVAYFFDYELDGALPDSAYEATASQVRSWQDAWKAEVRPSLTFWSTPDFLQIEDRRDAERPGTYTFRGALASIYAACSDRQRTAADLKEQLCLPWPEPEIAEALDEFCRLGLMMREGNSFLSLALPATRGR
jgi:ribosomal peptide maturation radical SAM protein 1